VEYLSRIAGVEPCALDENSICTQPEFSARAKVQDAKCATCKFWTLEKRDNVLSIVCGARVDRGGFFSVVDDSVATRRRGNIEIAWHGNAVSLAIVRDALSVRSSAIRWHSRSNAVLSRRRASSDREKTRRFRRSA